jgi:hydrogenase maturation protease
MKRPLVICIGNEARGDDGVGHAVARALGERGRVTGARILTATGLDVAMAEDVAAAELVIVVDAERRSFPDVDVREVREESAPSHPHDVDVPSLLGTARALYGGAPSAWLVTVAAPQMEHGSSLSSTAEAASLEAASAVEGLLAEVWRE